VVKHYCIWNTSEGFWKCLLKFGNVIPSLLSDPIKWRLGELSASVKNLTTSKEEVPFITADDSAN